MSKPISEETKARISELYKTSDQSMGVIAQALGVSERTVRRYKNYSGLGRTTTGRPGRILTGLVLWLVHLARP